MSEPRTRARVVEELLPGLLHWQVQDDRLDFRSDAWALRGSDGLVLVDPLPLEDEALASLGRVALTCLTGAFHQRAAWTLRRRLGAPVWAPRGAHGLEERPDREHADGDALPGGLASLRRHGPTQPHHVLHAVLDGRRVLFLGDLLMRDGSGPLSFVPDDHQDDPAATRESVRSLLALEPDVLCPAHGAAVLGDATGAIREALGGR